MTAAVAWAPSTEETLTTLLRAVRAWTPLDGEAVLEDVGAVLDDVIPAEGRIEDLAERLRAHVRQLVAIAVASEAADDPAARLLVERARAMQGEPLPAGHWPAVGHVRRLAWSVNELLERLGALRCLKEFA